MRCISRSGPGALCAVLMIRCESRRVLGRHAGRAHARARTRRSGMAPRRQAGWQAGWRKMGKEMARPMRRAAQDIERTPHNILFIVRIASCIGPICIYASMCIRIRLHNCVISRRAACAQAQNRACDIRRARGPSFSIGRPTSDRLARQPVHIADSRAWPRDLFLK